MPSDGQTCRHRVTRCFRSMEDVVALLDAREAPPVKRGPYKKRIGAAKNAAEAVEQTG